MYDHERSLVKRLEGQPFVLLGINSDDNRQELEDVLKREKITWRFWWDRGAYGPISSKWRVDGWPAIYILDHQGVIRHKYPGFVGGATLDADVDSLLNELRGKGAS